MKYIWRLLREHVSMAQLIGFFIANLVGMTIILLGCQFYADASPILGDTSPELLKKEYIVLSKPVTTNNMLQTSASTFTPDDILDLKEQTFINRLGCFESSQYYVYLSLTLPLTPLRIGSDIFFEAVENDYLDVKSEKWRFSPEKKHIPIILPRNYLNLYNFGYAQARHLPRLAKEVLEQIVMQVRIQGNGHTETFTGQIVGFSNRLNTILVPHDFMQWSNKRYGKQKSSPSRLIVEVDNPTDEQLVNYCQQKNYEVENNGLGAGKIAFFVRLAAAGVVVVGLCISLLAFYLLLLSLFLLLQKNQQKLQTLLLIGYSPTMVSLPYQGLAIFINSFVLLFSTVIVAFLQHYYMELIRSFYPLPETVDVLQN